MFSLRQILRRGRRGRLPGAGQLVLGGEPPAAAQNLLQLDKRVRERVTIEQAELLTRRGKFFVRLRSAGGVEGVAVGSDRLT